MNPIDFLFYIGSPQEHPLTFLTFAPVLGALVILFIPSRFGEQIKTVAAVTCGLVLLGAVWLGFSFDTGDGGMQFVEQMNWISSFNIEYHMGVDGLSITLVLLTAFISFIAVFASWGINKGIKGYFAMFLLLQTGMTGVFVSLDFFLFYVFWEVMLLPMYFLIGIWGGKKRVYAAIKFFLYTFVGSVLMLLAILALYFESAKTLGTPTFNMLELAALGQAGKFASGAFSLAPLVWWGLFIGFLIKVPSVPVHTWLPDAHVQAPTAISVILAGVLLKMGGYGILRVNLAILPDMSTHYAEVMAVLGTVSIVYGGLAAFAQKDFKKLVAYSSVASMGFVMLGIAAMTSTSISGAIFHMVNHGFYSSALFLIVGVIYDRAHTRDFGELGGGLAAIMPQYTGISGLVFMAALGLPGLAVFISEAMVLLGSFQVFPVYVIIAATGIIITAAYMLWTMQRVFLGELKREDFKVFGDVSWRERFTLYPLCACLVIFGFYPRPILQLMEQTVNMLSGVFGATLP